MFTGSPTFQVLTYTSKSKPQRLTALAFAGSSALAQDKVQSKTQDPTQDQDQLQEPVYGSQLMTVAERGEFRVHMRIFFKAVSSKYPPVQKAKHQSFRLTPPSSRPSP